MEIREIQDFEDGAFVVPANNKEMIFVYRKTSFYPNFYVALRGDGTLYFPPKHNKARLESARAATPLEIRYFHTALAIAGVRWNYILKEVENICEM